MGTTVAELLVQIKGDAQSAIDALNQTDASIQRTSSNSSSALKGLGLLAGALGVAADAAMVGSVKSAASFEQMLGQIQHNTTMTTAQAQEMGQTIRLMAGESGASLSSLADGFMHITNLGFQGADAVNILRTAMESAVATGSDVGATANVLAQALHEFNLQGDQAGVVMDRLHLAAAEGNQTLDQLVNTSGKAVSAAAALGVPMQDVLAAISALTREGRPAAQAATEVTAAIQHIVSPTQQAQAELARLSQVTGIDLVGDFSQAGIQAKGLSGVLQDVGAATQGNEAEVLKLIPALRGGLAAMVLSSTGAKDYTDILRDLNGVTAQSGIVHGQYQEQLHQAANQAGILGQQAKQLAIDTGQALLPAAEGLMHVVEPLVVDLDHWTQAHPGLTAAILGTVGVMGTFVGLMTAAGMVAGPLGTSFTLAARGLQAMSEAAFGADAGMTAMLGPIGLVAAGVAGLTIAYVALAESANRGVQASQANIDFYKSTDAGVQQYVGDLQKQGATDQQIIQIAQEKRDAYQQANDALESQRQTLLAHDTEQAKSILLAEGIRQGQAGYAAQLESTVNLITQHDQALGKLNDQQLANNASFSAWQTIIDQASGRISAASQATADLAAHTQTVGAQANLAGPLLRDLAQATESLTTNTITFIGQSYDISNLSGKLAVLKLGSDELTQSYRDAKSAQDALFNAPIPQSDEEATALSLLKVQLDGVQRSMNDFVVAGKPVPQDLQNQAKAIGQLMTNHQLLKQQIDDGVTAMKNLIAEHHSGQLTDEAYAQAVKGLQDSMGPLAAVLNPLIASEQNLNQAATDAASAMEHQRSFAAPVHEAFSSLHNVLDQQLIPALHTAAQTADTELATAAQGIATNIGTMGSKISETKQQIATDFVTIYDDGHDMHAKLKPEFDGIATDFTTSAHTFQTGAQPILDVLTQMPTNAGTAKADTDAQLSTVGQASIPVAASNGQAVGNALGLGVENGIRGMIDAVASAAAELVNSAVAAARAAAGNPQSPSPVTRARVGRPLGEGAIAGLQDTAAERQAAFSAAGAADVLAYATASDPIKGPSAGAINAQLAAIKRLVTGSGGGGGGGGTRRSSGGGRRAGGGGGGGGGAAGPDPATTIDPAERAQHQVDQAALESQQAFFAAKKALRKLDDQDAMLSGQEQLAGQREISQQTIDAEAAAAAAERQAAVDASSAARDAWLRVQADHDAVVNATTASARQAALDQEKADRQLAESMQSDADDAYGTWKEDAQNAYTDQIALWKRENEGLRAIIAERRSIEQDQWDLQQLLEEDSEHHYQLTTQAMLDDDRRRADSAKQRAIDAEQAMEQADQRVLDDQTALNTETDAARRADLQAQLDHDKDIAQSAHDTYQLAADEFHHYASAVKQDRADLKKQDEDEKKLAGVPGGQYLQQISNIKNVTAAQVQGAQQVIGALQQESQADAQRYQQLVTEAQRTQIQIDAINQELVNGVGSFSAAFLRAQLPALQQLVRTDTDAANAIIENHNQILDQIGQTAKAVEGQIRAADEAAHASAAGAAGGPGGAPNMQEGFVLGNPAYGPVAAGYRGGLYPLGGSEAASSPALAGAPVAQQTFTLNLDGQTLASSVNTIQSGLSSLDVSLV